MTALQTIGRAAGVLLHPTSLPSGRLDADARRWIDWLAAAGVKVWQMLPLGVPLVGLSPYQCASAFAINPALFAATSTLTLPRKGGGNKNLYPEMSSPPSSLTGPGMGGNFDLWYEAQKHWVEDYALFMVLKQQFAGQEWHEWPEAFRHRDPDALFRLRSEHSEALADIIHAQYACWREWQALRAYASERDVFLFGDMPIFVAYDSADVWAHPERFMLDADGAPTHVTGVPPDYFSATGQRWGNPHYNWEYMQQENFLWWKQRLAYHFEFFDLVRIDHFRGLAASWMIPADEATAVHGYWEDVPGNQMLGSVRASMGELPLVAEDLGVITPDVTALRDQFGLPGMSVLQFGFDHFEDNPHKPHNVRNNTVYYTGTHDNDTLLGWFHSLDENGQQGVMQVLEITDPARITTAMLATVFASPALLAVVPMQDLLQLGNEARMNVPGTVEGNWQWRFSWADLPDNLAADLRKQLQQHQRTGAGIQDNE